MIALDTGLWFREQVFAGSLVVALPVAVFAGAVSFFSPCVLPLLPGYLSYATGLSGADLQDARRGRMLLGSFLFVLGFSAVFVAYGALFGSLGEWLIVYSRQISIVLGLFTVVVGLAFVGLVPFLQRDVRVHRVPAVGLMAAPLLGVLFGVGWTPCIGPTLTAVESLAVHEATAVRGAVLSLFYALGLGIPFLVAGLAFRRSLGAFRWVRRHQVWVTRLGGVMLIAVGVLLVSGQWDRWVVDVQSLLPGYEAPV